jgi:hypothetical protein
MGGAFIDDLTQFHIRHRAAGGFIMFLRGSRTSQNHSPRRYRIGGRRRQRFAPVLLALEARALLSALTVTNDADSGKGSLRYELSLARNGDTIVFSPKAYGTITLTSGPLEVATGVDIKGPGAKKVTVSGDDSSTVFEVDGGVTASISGMTITDGLGSTFGEASTGGILNQGTLTLTDAVLTNNVNRYSFFSFGYSGGGGILNQGTMTIAGSIISGNTGINAGGIDNSGTLSISDSTISGNSCGAGGGGGIFNQGTLTLTDAVLTGNTSPSRTLFQYVSSGGGGLVNTGTMTIAGSSISGNTGSGAGGIASYGSLSISDSTISGNSGDGWFGTGGIVSGESQATSPLTLTDSTISGNSGTYIGGISSDGVLDIIGSAVSGNQAGVFNSPFDGLQAGGIFCEGTATITGSRIVNNTNHQTRPYSAYGGGIDDDGDLTITGSTISGNTVESDFDLASGGGIDMIGSAQAKLTVNHCTFQDNQAIANWTYGGGAGGGAIGVLDGDATVTISGCSFVNNSASGTGTAGGGALALGAASASVVDCAFTGDQAVVVATGNPFDSHGASGGAIAGNGPLAISGSTFVGNLAQGGLNGGSGTGGAIAQDGTGATLNLSSSLFLRNRALGGDGAGEGVGSGGGRAAGGGVWNGDGAAATVTGSTFIGNVAVGGSTGPATGSHSYQGGNAEGGAIANTYDSSLSVTGCIIAGNSATGGGAAPGRNNVVAGAGQGGGIFDRDGSLQVTDSTISGNAAVAGNNGYSFDNGGGGVFVSGTSAHASFTDVLITLNSATVASGSGQANGGGIYIGTGALTTLKKTEVIGNHASTAGDNIYGTYIEE